MEMDIGNGAAVAGLLHCSQNFDKAIRDGHPSGVLNDVANDLHSFHQFRTIMGWQPRPGPGNCTRRQMSWRSTPGVVEVIRWFLNRISLISDPKSAVHNKYLGSERLQCILEVP